MNHLYDQLRSAKESLDADRVCLQDLASLHGQAAQGAWLILLALPCALPIPGTGTVLGMGLMILAWRMLQGQDMTQLPQRVGRFELSRDHAHKVLSALCFFHGLAGRWCRTRLPALVERLEDPSRWSVLPLKVALMAVLIVLPIPFGNVLPALAVAMLGLALVHRDGLMVMLSTVMAALAATYVAGLGLSVWLLGDHWLTNFGLT